MQEETTETRGPSSDPSPRREWLGPSGWIALAILLVYGMLTFVHPFIPIVIVAGAMEELIFYGVPALGGVLWVIAMFVRLRDRGACRPGLVAWIAIRYAIVSVGVAGLMVMEIGSRTPGYIRFTARFREQMRESADVVAIREWVERVTAEQRGFSTEEAEILWLNGEECPACVRELRPMYVMVDVEEGAVDLIFGGGLGHWGIHIGRPGASPPAGYTLPMEDGVWVWHEIQ
ncbi:MAG: hypothetical protein JXB13_14265 [Phycisphaerae bacterium]|nr:hypothetical protein [Phycisphaerae bacterium]